MSSYSSRSSVTSDEQKDEGQAIVSQIDELKQLFQDHERMIAEKSSRLEAISQQIDEIEQNRDYDGVFDSMRSRLDELLNNFHKKMGMEATKNTTQEHEIAILDTFDRLTAIENREEGELRSKMSRLQAYLHSDGHALGQFGHGFQDILHSASEFMNDIPMNETNTTNVNQLVALVEGCIEAFST